MLLTNLLRERLDSGKAIAILPGPYLDMCPNCGGLGAVMIFEVKGGPSRSPAGRGSKWLDDAEHKAGWYAGGLVSEPCPVCVGDKKRDWLEEQCNLEGADRYVVLDDFDTHSKLAGKQAAKQVATDLLAMNTAANGFYTLVGDYGVGKTLLLKIITNGMRNVGTWARYERMSDILATIREKFGEAQGGREVEAAIETYLRVRVLAIDEIDRINLTGWAKETVFRLLDGRFEQRHECLTVLASNTAPEAMPAELGYLRSRMAGGQVVVVAGPDMRPVIGQAEQRERKDLA